MAAFFARYLRSYLRSTRPRRLPFRSIILIGRGGPAADPSARSHEAPAAAGGVVRSVYALARLRVVTQTGTPRAKSNTVGDVESRWPADVLMGVEIAHASGGGA